MARLSHVPAERDLQKYIIAAVGWLIVSVLVAAVLAAPAVLDDPSGSEDAGPVGFVPVRAALGAVMTLISLRLAQLVGRHRGELRRVEGLKGQYGLACVVTMFFGSIVLFFWWSALPAAAVGLVCLAVVIATKRVPAEQRTESIDYLDPEAWEPRGGAQESVSSFSLKGRLFLLIGVPLLLVGLLVAGGLLYFELTGT